MVVAWEMFCERLAAIHPGLEWRKNFASTIPRSGRLQPSSTTTLHPFPDQYERHFDLQDTLSDVLR